MTLTPTTLHIDLADGQPTAYIRDGAANPIGTPAVPPPSVPAPPLEMPPVDRPPSVDRPQPTAGDVDSRALAVSDNSES